MPDDLGPGVRKARVRELLLGHLQAAAVPPWPGAIGLMPSTRAVSAGVCC
jgi:hypothetical protein